MSSDLQPIKEGWLWKVGGSVQSWKKRWMVVTRRKLAYYKDPGDSKPKGEIALDSASLHPLSNNNAYARANLIGITPVSSPRMYVIQAGSFGERQEWIDAIVSAGAFNIGSMIHTFPSHHENIKHALHYGFLDKTSHGSRSFFSSSNHAKVRAFFVLYKEKLVYWKSTADIHTAPVDECSLTPNSLLESGPIGGVTFDITSKLKANKWILTADDHESREEWIKYIRCVIQGKPVRNNELFQQKQSYTNNEDPENLDLYSRQSSLNSTHNSTQYDEDEWQNSQVSDRSRASSLSANAYSTLPIQPPPPPPNSAGQTPSHHMIPPPPPPASSSPTNSSGLTIAPPPPPATGVAPSPRSATAANTGAGRPVTTRPTSLTVSAAGTSKPKMRKVVSGHTSNASATALPVLWDEDGIPPPQTKWSDDEEDDEEEGDEDDQAGAGHGRDDNDLSDVYAENDEEDNFTIDEDDVNSSASQATAAASLEEELYHANLLNDGIPPPPPPPPEDETTGGVPPPPMTSGATAIVPSMSFLNQYPDVMLQMSTLLHTHFQHDLTTFKSFLNTFLTKINEAQSTSTVTSPNSSSPPTPQLPLSPSGSLASPAAPFSLVPLPTNINSQTTALTQLYAPLAPFFNPTLSHLSPQTLINGPPNSSGSNNNNNAEDGSDSEDEETTPAADGKDKDKDGKDKKASTTSGASGNNYMLHLHLVEGRDFPAMDANGFSDPYCLLWLRCKNKAHKFVGAKHKSKTILETLDPVWDQILTIDIPDYLVENSNLLDEVELIIDVFDFDKFSVDDFIGRTIISLNQLSNDPLTGTNEYTIPSHLSGSSSTSSGSTGPAHPYGISLNTSLNTKRNMSNLSWRGWCALGGKNDPWNTQGTLYLSMVLDRFYIEPSKRNNNVAFIQQRLGLLALQEQYFHRVPITHNVRVHITTWNVGNAAPPDDLSSLIPLGLADLYVVGTQECNYPPRGDVKSCKIDWLHCLIRHFGRQYSLVKYISLWEIRIALFALNKHVPYITNVKAYSEATGIANVLGNKGGTVISCMFHHTSLCFVNSHLAAHQQYTDIRNQNYRNIIKNIKMGSASNSDLINLHHHIFWCGDLNYRIDYGTQGMAKTPSKEQFQTMVSMIKKNNKAELEIFWQHDQLRKEMLAQRVFIGFQEGDYTSFPPTFKVKRKPWLEYTSQRSPAWCDRILWRNVNGYPVKQIKFGTPLDVGTSDHKPVCGLFEIPTHISCYPLDRTIGSCIVRVLYVKLNGLRVPRDPINSSSSSSSSSSGSSHSTGTSNFEADNIAASKEIDPFVIIQSPLLSKVIQTPTLKKTATPSWGELPAIPSNYNNVERIKNTLMFVRVHNHQSQDAIIGRGIISLVNLQPTNTNSADGGIIGVAKQMDLDIFVQLTYGGLPAGTLNAQLRFMWKEKEKKK